MRALPPHGPRLSWNMGSLKKKLLQVKLVAWQAPDPPTHNPYTPTARVLLPLPSLQLMQMEREQFQNNSSYSKNPHHIVFHSMDPYDLGILEAGADVVILIKIVFTLASRTPLTVVCHGPTTNYSACSLSVPPSHNRPNGNTNNGTATGTPPPQLTDIRCRHHRHRD